MQTHCDLVQPSAMPGPIAKEVWLGGRSGIGLLPSFIISLQASVSIAVGFQLNTTQHIATHRNATQYTDFKLQPLIGKLPSSLVAAVTPNLLIVANLNAAAVAATIVASLECCYEVSTQPQCCLKFPSA